MEVGSINLQSEKEQGLRSIQETKKKSMEQEQTIMA